MFALVLPSPAFAQRSGDLSSDPSVNQYVESVPTTTGSQPTTRRPGEKRQRLPPRVERKLREQDPDIARQLEEIATSPSLGAPGAGSTAGAGREGRGRGARDQRHTAAARDRDDRRGLSAAIEAAGVDGSGAMVVLLGALLLTTAVIGGAALVRRRSATD